MDDGGLTDCLTLVHHTVLVRWGMPGAVFIDPKGMHTSIFIDQECLALYHVMGCVLKVWFFFFFF